MWKNQMKNNQINAGTPQPNDKVVPDLLRIIAPSTVFSKLIITHRPGSKTLVQLRTQCRHLGPKTQLKTNPVQSLPLWYLLNKKRIKHPGSRITKIQDRRIVNRLGSKTIRLLKPSQQTSQLGRRTTQILAINLHGRKTQSELKFRAKLLLQQSISQRGSRTIPVLATLQTHQHGWKITQILPMYPLGQKMRAEMRHKAITLSWNKLLISNDKKNNWRRKLENRRKRNERKREFKEKIKKEKHNSPTKHDKSNKWRSKKNIRLQGRAFSERRRHAWRGKGKKINNEYAEKRKKRDSDSCRNWDKRVRSRKEEKDSLRKNKREKYNNKIKNRVLKRPSC
mgnify:CR=1 FL=1